MHSFALYRWLLKRKNPYPRSGMEIYLWIGNENVNTTIFA